MKKILFAIGLFCLQFMYAQVPPGGGAGGSTPGNPDATPIDTNIWILMAAAVVMMGFYAYRQMSRRVN